MVIIHMVFSWEIFRLVRSNLAYISIAINNTS